MTKLFITDKTKEYQKKLKEAGSPFIISESWGDFIKNINPSQAQFNLFVNQASNGM